MITLTVGGRSITAPVTRTEALNYGRALAKQDGGGLVMVWQDGAAGTREPVIIEGWAPRGGRIIRRKAWYRGRE